MSEAYAAASGWFFGAAIEPALFAMGLMDWEEEAFDWMGFLLAGVLQMVVAYAICRPLEAWRPVEGGPRGKLVRTDVAYTFIARLGVLPLLTFVLFAPAGSAFQGWAAETLPIPLTLEALVPWLREHPVLAFLVYVVILDFGEYWRHRLQHSVGWWWALHSLHHAQRRMTFWTEDRNHILDDILAAVWFGAIALLIGVPPGQFPLIVLLLRVAESLSHADVRLSYGHIGERALVSPRFHRAHHGLLAAGQAGVNYAALLPLWDCLFQTSNFQTEVYPRTGDPSAPETMTTGGWWGQQAAGLRRMGRAILRCRS